MIDMVMWIENDLLYFLMDKQSVNFSAKVKSGDSNFYSQIEL